MSDLAAARGMGLEGGSIVVTGGASNIGRAIVLAAAAEGARVTIWDIDVEQAERTAVQARRLTEVVEVVRCDATDPAAVEEATARTLAARGAIDVLVNNVGWNRPEWFGGLDLDDIDKAIRINLMSAICTTRAVLPSMLERGAGCVVSVASDAAFGELRTSVYGAAKAGVVALMKALALEYGRKGLRFNVVAPGLVLPSGPEAVGHDSLWAVGGQTVIDDKGRGDIERSLPLRRLTAPEDVAGSVLFLASERLARQLTGQVLSVSGGKHMPG